MSSIDNPMPIVEIESILGWVDTYKLSRPTKKINRDFSDAVLLAEILNVHYPKLIEMHNYPPRNSHAMKLNNWMTLNRKVLKKLKLNLCSTTMDQLANSHPGIIERVLVMVRDKIQNDEQAKKETDQQLSSGGSYYEACGDENSVLVVPMKTRVNGVLETVQQKVVCYNSYTCVKEELKDAKENIDVLRQKVEHLENLIKLKEERIDELQKQLERKTKRRKDVEALQNSLSVPFDNNTSPLPSPKSSHSQILNSATKIPSIKSIKSEHTIVPPSDMVPIPKIIEVMPKKLSVEFKTEDLVKKTSETKREKLSNTKINTTPAKELELETGYEYNYADVDIINSEVFKETETDSLDGRSESVDEFKDSVTDVVVTIEDSIRKEINDIKEEVD